MAKTIVCQCEDVSLDEVYSAVRQGYCEIESLKRYTGIGTGKCQGKQCIVQTLRALAGKRGADAAASGLGAGPGESLLPPANDDTLSMIRIPTVRQPVTPLRIDDIAAGGDDEGDDA